LRVYTSPYRLTAVYSSKQRSVVKWTWVVGGLVSAQKYNRATLLMSLLLRFVLTWSRRFVIQIPRALYI